MKAPEVLSPRGRTKSFEAAKLAGSVQGGKGEENLAPSRRFWLELDRATSHLLALIANVRPTGRLRDFFFFSDLSI